MASSSKFMIVGASAGQVFVPTELTLRLHKHHNHVLVFASIFPKSEHSSLESMLDCPKIPCWLHPVQVLVVFTFHSVSFIVT